MNIEKLQKLHSNVNIANDLDENLLREIGIRSCEEFLIDEASRTEWLNGLKEAIKIAKQVMEQKTTPWAGAANVKYPLITSAVISFASRTYPEIIHNDRVVLAGIIGQGDQEMKEQIANRISTHMSYQLLVESPNWEDDTDKLLHLLALMGVVYRKTYFDEINQIPGTELCLPDKITVNHHIKNIESARRVTHQLEMYDNDLIERMRAGLYREIDLKKLQGMDDEGQYDKLHNILEIHRYWDLDDDGYKEPYIITIQQDTQEVLRIKARWDMENVQLNDKGKIVRIAPTCYFTDYHFLRNPDGGFHSIGYGTLLYPLNEVINTTINQLLDAGTLSNRQSGFLGKGLRMKKGVNSFLPGEWKIVEAANGTDIGRNVVPLPVRDPSPVSLQLLSMMIAAGKELASVSDIMQGQQNTQNSPATTVLTLLQQALKTHTAIVKRLYRSLSKEFEKLVRINRIYLDDVAYYETFDGQEFISRQDYANEKLRVFPIADPNLSSEAQRMARIQALVQQGAALNLNPLEIAKRWVETMQFPDPEKLLPPPPDPNAPPPPEIVKTEAEADLLKAKAADLLMGRELEALKLEISDKDREARAAEAGARATKMHSDTVKDFAKLEQENAHFAVEKAMEDTLQTEEQGAGTMPVQPAVNIEPVMQQILSQMPQAPAPAPMPPMAPNAPMPENPEQLPEGVPMQ